MPYMNKNNVFNRFESHNEIIVEPCIIQNDREYHHEISRDTNQANDRKGTNIYLISTYYTHWIRLCCNFGNVHSHLLNNTYIHKTHGYIIIDIP